MSRESVILEYEERMLSLRPLGGSVTTLRLRCRMPMGNRSVGSVVSHSLKSCIKLQYLFTMCSINHLILLPCRLKCAVHEQ